MWRWPGQIMGRWDFRKGTGDRPAAQEPTDSVPARPSAESPEPSMASGYNVGACTRRLRCLSRLAEYVQRYDQIDTLLRDVAAMIPFGWEHADRAHAEIHWDGRSYRSDGFERGPWTLRRDIPVDGRSQGYVEISYSEEGLPREGGPFLKEEGDLIEAIALLLGVAIERRRAKECLGQAEQKFLDLFNQAHNGVLLIERYTRRCCLANPIFCQMFGYPPDEIPDLQLSDIQPPPDDVPRIDPAYEPLLGQHALRQDVPLRRHDGSLFFADVSSFPVLVGDKEYWLDIFKDVTERTGATSRQEKAMEELRTSSRELNDFVYLVSHDLKAVHRGMNFLGHWACGGLSGLSEAEVRAQTSLLGERVERLDDLVSVMVRYSRIGQGDEPQTIVDLQEVVRDLLGAMAVPPRISVEIERTLPVLRMRRTVALDILGCLLGNAVRQIDQAEGVIRIGCTDEGGSWRVNIRDSGPGIDPPYHEGLFRLFQATPNGHWEDFGVALAMAKRSVETYGGHIGVESTMGGGSTFFFTLPKADSLEPLLLGRDIGE